MKALYSLGFCWKLPGEASFQGHKKATWSYVCQGETTEDCGVSIHALFNPSDCVETPLNSGQVSVARPFTFNRDSVWKQHQYHTWNRRSSSQNSLDVTHIFLAVSHWDPEYSTCPHMFADQYQLHNDGLSQLIKIYKFYKFLLCLIIVSSSEKVFLWTAF